ncbi:hypothetical protein MBCUT_06580 [Methanobrevibacter cuticularis]|uniref:Uncharacterized protein n=1 Tax=Methanobrevibacter cuticularis TaxID=47311 RepID=A0A166EGA3_9EURY|nr:hypothetical protein MBCUT_06580 [Methanobrevibacter cuticularis]
MNYKIICQLMIYSLIISALLNVLGVIFSNISFFIVSYGFICLSFVCSIFRKGGL